MAETGSFEYESNDLFQGVRLPYGNGRLGMILFLPQPDKSLSDLESHLSAAEWNRWMAALQLRQGAVALPRFRFTYDAVLNQPLEDLGMAPAFHDPDFAGVSREADLSIGEVRYKTAVGVNEEGTEAAAATSVTVQRTLVLPGEGFNLRFDRPFLAAIVDHDTGAILFLGYVADPVAG